MQVTEACVFPTTGSRHAHDITAGSQHAHNVMMGSRPARDVMAGSRTPMMSGSAALFLGWFHPPENFEGGAVGSQSPRHISHQVTAQQEEPLVPIISPRVPGCLQGARTAVLSIPKSTLILISLG